MRPETIKLLHDTDTVLSAVELGQIVDTDRETVNNWNRRDIITRFAPGGRRLKNSAVFDRGGLQNGVDEGVSGVTHWTISST